MKIQTLKDLKLALKDVPDEFLEDFGVGFNEEQDAEILVYCDESEFNDKWESVKKVCPAIDDINKWIQNISKASRKMEESEGDYEGIGTEDSISSEDKV